MAHGPRTSWLKLDWCNRGRPWWRRIWRHQEGEISWYEGKVSRSKTTFCGDYTGIADFRSTSPATDLSALTSCKTRMSTLDKVTTINSPTGGYAVRKSTLYAHPGRNSGTRSVYKRWATVQICPAPQVKEGIMLVTTRMARQHHTV
jgi:hypothetical protein